MYSNGRRIIKLARYQTYDEHKLYFGWTFWEKRWGPNVSSAANQLNFKGEMYHYWTSSTWLRTNGNLYQLSNLQYIRDVFSVIIGFDNFTTIPYTKKRLFTWSTDNVYQKNAIDIVSRVCSNDCRGLSEKWTSYFSWAMSTKMV